MATHLNTKLDIIKCASHSRIKRDLSGEGFLELIEHEVKFHKLKSLEEHFDAKEERIDRNFAIMNALHDGYSQASISRFLKTSTSLILKITKEIKWESGHSSPVPNFF
ncbi:MAG TPA: hypothetical protein EYO73_00665 [Sulfurimonas sp.]|nr:hypothetical protein [Sulfurimonas sp.]